MIVFATAWRGFEASDRIHAIDIADDFGRVHEITERPTQGGPMKALSRLILETDVLSDPALMGLPDTDLPRYYGISSRHRWRGHHRQHTRNRNAVFNVGGGAWSTMLERSAQWIPFDWIMVENIPSSKPTASTPSASCSGTPSTPSITRKR